MEQVVPAFQTVRPICFGTNSNLETVRNFGNGSRGRVAHYRWRFNCEYDSMTKFSLKNGDGSDNFTYCTVVVHYRFVDWSIISYEMHFGYTYQTMAFFLDIGRLCS